MNDNEKIRYNNFIEKLYNSPSATSQDKERIVKLLLSEREKGFVTEEKVRELIKKEMLHSDNNFLYKPRKKDALEDIPYRPPYYLSDFLEEYNKDYPVLKYTCHTIDSEDIINDICNKCNTDNYDFEKHRQLIIEHYNDLVSKYDFIDNKVKSMIYGYLTGENTNGKKVKWASAFEDSWGSDNIRRWALENPGKVPNPGPNVQFEQRYEACPLSMKYASPLTGDPIIGFDELVLCFKSLFHIKKDNNLEDILSFVEKKIMKRYNDVKFVRTDFHTELELFTNVQALQRAYEKIVNICMECGRGKQIETTFFENNNGNKCITITDVGSVFGKSVSDIVNRPGDRILDMINGQINGMCDLYLISDFPDGQSYEINLWDKTKKRIPIKIERVNGVKYLLEFKKS